MKYIYFLIATSPEFSFTLFDFDAFRDLLFSNLLIVALLFFASILLATAVYFSVCCLTLWWNQLMGYSAQPKDFIQESALEN